MTMTASAPSIGHNSRELRDITPAVIQEDLRRKHKDTLERVGKLIEAGKDIPDKIGGDEEAGRVQDWVQQTRTAIATADAMRKLEGKPFSEAKKAADGVFQKPVDELELVRTRVTKAHTAYLEEKAAAERLAREEEARRHREEAERQAAIAREQEQKRLEAEQKRLEAERAAREAEEFKLRQQREAEEAKERARKAKEEEQRLDAERKERERREAEEAAERKRRREAEEAAAAEERERRRVEEEARLADARARREAEEKAAAEAKAKAAEARARQAEAERAAAAAKREERTAGRQEKEADGKAERLGARADRAENTANSSAADLSRTRSDMGSVGSLASHWRFEVLDIDAVPLETLRPYLHPDEIRTAIQKFMAAGGRDLPGVHFFIEHRARVAG